jgi:hypothetical protein
VLAAAHGGARVASEGFDPHSHLHPISVGGGRVGLTGPVFYRYGPARIQGPLDGGFRPHPSRRNYKGCSRFEGPVRHALKAQAREACVPPTRFLIEPRPPSIFYHEL